MGCATGMVKYLVFFANFVFVLAGLALMTIGVIIKFNYMKQVSIEGVPSEFETAALLSIIVGAFVFITAFFGCCGAIRESTCMLTTYSIILLSIFIIQVAIGVFVFLQVKDNGDFQKEIRRGVEETVKQYPNNRKARDAMDLTQTFLQCCGANGPSDYQWSNGTIPSSCCRNHDTNCRTTSSDVNQHGCTTEIINFLKNSAKVLGYVVIGIASIEILGALFGLCLASSIRNHYRRNIYA